jgi:hypothetical protein
VEEKKIDSAEDCRNAFIGVPAEFKAVPFTVRGATAEMRSLTRVKAGEIYSKSRVTVNGKDEIDACRYNALRLIESAYGSDGKRIFDDAMYDTLVNLPDNDPLWIAAIKAINEVSSSEAAAKN